MLVQFMRPVTLGAHTYRKGAHDVPEADARGWFFDALLADGSIAVQEAAKAPADAPEAVGQGEDAPAPKKRATRAKKGE